MKRALLIIIIIYVKWLASFGQIQIEYWMDRATYKIDKERDYTSALSDLNMILHFHSDYDDYVLYCRAYAKYYLGDYRGAIEDCNKAIAIKSYASSYYLQRGRAKEQLFDIKGALDDYNTAIDLKPSDSYIRITRGLFYLNKKKYDEAILDFNHAVDANPKSYDGYLYRAIGYQCQELFIVAMNDFNKAIQIAPVNAEVSIRRGRCFYDMKKYDKAMDDFDRAIRIDSVNSFAYFNRACTKEETTDFAGALKDYAMVIRLDPDNALTYYNRGNLKARVGDYQGAIADYTQVITINPNNVFTYFNRAITWQRLEQNRKAILDYSKAIELNPEFATAYYNRSIARRSVNDLKGAALDYDIATRLQESLKDPKHTNAIDSTGLAKLTNLKADFEEGNVKPKTVSQDGIYPFSIFSISYAVNDSADMNPLTVNPRILALNKQNTRRGSYRLTCLSDTIANDIADKEIADLTPITKSTASPLMLLESAILKSKIQDYNGSLADYTNLLTIDPQYSLGYFNRANTRYEMISFLKNMADASNNIVSIGGTNTQTQQAQRKIVQNYNDVVADYKHCIQLDPSFQYAYFNLGNVDITMHNYTIAIEDYSQAISHDAKFAEAYYNRGLTYIFMQKKEAGCRDLSNAGELGIQRAYMVIKRYCD